MAEEGITADRSISLIGNGAGAFSSFGSLAGLSNPVTGPAAALAGGISWAQNGNDFARRHHLAGDRNPVYEDPGPADFKDNLADDGRGIREVAGGKIVCSAR